LKKDKDKIQLNVSGSDTAEVSEPEELPQQKLVSFDATQVDKVMEQILNLTWVEKEFASVPAEPSYIINTEKDSVWLYSLTRRAYFEIANKSEIISIDQVSDDTSHCMINNDLFEVDNEIIMYLGWN
jgi:hypothetical protein